MVDVHDHLVQTVVTLHGERSHAVLAHDGTDRCQTRGLSRAAMVAPAGRLSGGDLTARAHHLDYSR
jgi:hypothetical protein